MLCSRKARESDGLTSRGLFSILGKLGNQLQGNLAAFLTPSQEAGSKRSGLSYTHSRHSNYSRHSSHSIRTFLMILSLIILTFFVKTK